MKLDEKFMKKVYIQYIAMFFTVFSFIAIEIFLSYAKREIDMVMVLTLSFIAILFLASGYLLAILIARKKKPKEEI